MSVYQQYPFYPFQNLHRFFTALTGTDTHGVLCAANVNFTVSAQTGVRSLFYGRHNAIKQFVFTEDFYF